MINEKKVNNIQYQILNELDRICKKRNIKFFLTGGSLLGACKYKRIIKGDKDIDVGMLRTDYQKFISICLEELNSKFSLVCMENSNNYYWPFAKILYNNSSFNHKKEFSSNSEKIYIDICPYDYVSPNIIVRNIYRIRIKYYKWLLILNNKDYKPSGIIKKFLKNISKLYTRKKLIYKLSNTMKKENAVVQNFVGGTETDWFYLEELMDLENKPFGNNSYPCPQYKRYLSANYGDYECKEITRTELYNYDVKIWDDVDEK